MAFDGIVTRAIAKELNEELQSGRIMKIYQPTETELLLTVRAYGQNQSLLLSVHPNYARAHLTQDRYQNPTEPPMFCMLLRKHLVGSFIQKIEQYENERIIDIHVEAKNEIGDRVNRLLKIEIMGKHSNIILIDSEKGHILDSIKHLSPYQNRHRTILPGQLYVDPPSQGKQNPDQLTEAQITESLNNAEDDDLKYGLVNQFMGVSPIFAEYMLEKASTRTAEALAKTLKQTLETVNQGQIEPVIHRGKRDDFHVFPLHTYEGDIYHYNRVSDMLDTFYSDKATRDLVKQQAHDLTRLLKNEHSKNKRKIKKQQDSLKKAEKAATYQKLGELLTAHLHLVKQGDESVDVIDYYDENQSTLTIELNPNKTPSENAQYYFKMYQKLKTSKQKLSIEIEKAEKENDYFDQLIQQIESARLSDIEEIREELREEGYLKSKTKDKKKKRRSNKPEPQKFISSDGTPMYVGRNNKQNDYLTSKMADKRDYWLHTKDIPGSHVVIRSNQPSEETLLEAAQLAASFSKASQSSSVPVDYTLIRHVKKPNGAKPGYVTYDEQKTLFVTPDEEIIKKLKKTP
ncbi:Predicted component of the ribosome quality control (RQC) complex, YloA/Tae2 family, contains fibronectin-binding (FbpA) and DUF814 domains [Pelagirhabdus alkalitolerans]|uniref:Rqc2 homolog RqcH n=1 Tax=Pelagirhabdus alkalitolerans TaxID=1612202 RepID=A0A1G6H183_9BACI|nr:NFACT RNA binding domain-containing protein [Pelagirhabdus alkalitolerans]SDB87951.1 Predicted component of the ribosome quality control (RQC) complex, YloA/Tae2 family, contains fibronectin-binding (FbpA) and DUF814 domains [Pelagirhabdus alkalitolerans]